MLLFSKRCLFSFVLHKFFYEFINFFVFYEKTVTNANEYGMIKA